MIQNQLKAFQKLALNNFKSLQTRGLYSFLDTKDPSRRTTSKNSYDNLEKENHYQASFLEEQEIQARMLKCAREFPEVNLKQFDWEADFKKLGLDSLNRVAYIVSIEHEFNMVFPDRVFDNFNTPEDITRYISSFAGAFKKSQ
ncbi:Acyl carrier protein-like protein [Pseudocohnilembus persalinus]|uniref:Acyl carrier protein n=1 Tax=Pseudocohnilembus persalinus TaxID=266149 RepID=A0A0V0R0U2_PSEPJ|nr:Acyl carrier protein-like protein [Pseudocohnilembus persalinus]|eukprot:KRX08178.1 Acyl carrier protein-like protein [Pseudocohnilembus persalinus]